VEWDKKTRVAWFYNLFGLFWYLGLILTMGQFMVIVSASTWYFSHNTDESGKNEGGSAKVCKGLKWMLRYHFGSLALGSLILAVVWVIKVCTKYFRKRFARQQGRRNEDNTERLKYCVLCMCNCYFRCISRFTSFISRAAYIQVAISSTNFCLSAYNAYMLQYRHVVKFALVQTFGFVFIFVSKIFIATLATILGFTIMVSWPWINDKLSTPVIPTIVMFLITYVIASLFMSIYSIASATIMQCFLLDLEMSSIKTIGGGDGIAPH
jgi:hypothetical protein